MSNISDRFALKYDPEQYRRVIAGREVILHCHHYNSRMQSTIEGATQVDGKNIFALAAEATFVGHIKAALLSSDDAATKSAVVSGLYSHLGYGALDLSQMEEGHVSASASHFVEGWSAGFGDRKTPVCTFTEGFLQAAQFALNGEAAFWRETECMITGASACKFERVPGRTEPMAGITKRPLSIVQKKKSFLTPESVDGAKIVSALVSMPIHGNAEGLIPAFGVYLANTPADFYNLASIRFIEEMDKLGLGKTAQRLLVSDAETCAMNTFRGIMSSPEWAGLVAPMIKQESDNLYGVVAVSNALGWGNWHVDNLAPGRALRIESLNGYEAYGFRELRGTSPAPQCFMLRGVAAGIMGLVFGSGTVEERTGTYGSTETECICSESPSCVFSVEKL